MKWNFMVSFMEIMFEKFSCVNITPGFAKLYYKNPSNKLDCVKYARIWVWYRQDIVILYLNQEIRIIILAYFTQCSTK